MRPFHKNQPLKKILFFYFMQFLLCFQIQLPACIFWKEHLIHYLLLNIWHLRWPWGHIHNKLQNEMNLGQKSHCVLVVSQLIQSGFGVYPQNSTNKWRESNSKNVGRQNSFVTITTGLFFHIYNFNIFLNSKSICNDFQNFR